MKRSSFPRMLAVAPVALLGLSSCATISDTVGSAFGRNEEGLEQVDDLLSRIELVHVEAELARESMHGAMGALQTLASPKFKGDPMVAYADFVEAVERSEDQAEALTDSLKPMKKAADSFFEQWADDLTTFSSLQMRQRAQQRLEATRKRYDAIVMSLEPTATAYEAFNVQLQDHVLFLGNDFNMAAVSALGPEVSALTDQSERLDKRFAISLRAAQQYVRTSAMPGQVAVPQDEG